VRSKINKIGGPISLFFSSHLFSNTLTVLYRFKK
jgi:hypothetical protein